jgi:hypothetical protein
VIRLFAILLTISLSAHAADPALLQLRVVQGEGAVYAIGSRATRGVAVQVTDETGKPVPEAVVSFRLPEAGPSGEFAKGGRTEVVTTAADGRAEVWGMLWNRDIGSLDLRITAAKGTARGGVICSLYLSDASVLRSDTEPTLSLPEKRSHKRLWITIGAIAAASVSVLGVAGRSSASGITPPAATILDPIANTKIGNPTISLGRP